MVRLCVVAEIIIPFNSISSPLLLLLLVSLSLSLSFSFSLSLSLSLSLSPSLSSSDYGFKPADGLNGPCVLDEAVPLDDPCADGQVKTVMKSRGYRKVAGDVCITGAAGPDFEPYEFTCCVSDVHPTNLTPSVNPSPTYRPSSSTTRSSASPTDPNPSAKVIVTLKDSKAVVTGLGVALAITVLIAISLGLLAAISMW